jgi:hypothetical protein
MVLARCRFSQLSQLGCIAPAKASVEPLCGRNCVTLDTNSEIEPTLIRCNIAAVPEILSQQLYNTLKNMNFYGRGKLAPLQEC